MANADSDHIMRVYYIDNGAIHQLGEVSLNSEAGLFFESALLYKGTGKSEVIFLEANLGLFHMEVRS